MKQRLLTMLLALVAMMMPIGAWALNYTLKMPNTGITTLCVPFALDLPEGVYAYIVTDVITHEDGTVQLVEKEITDVIPAGTPMIIRGDQASYSLTVVLEPFPAIEDNNLLMGTLEPMPLDVSSETGNFMLCYTDESSEYGLELADWQAPVNNGSSTYTLSANKAYLDLSGKLEPSKIAELKHLPHMQHTHGGCEICGQNTGVIVINMSDSSGDGWNGASITVKKDGEELDETVTIEDGTEATVTLVYDLDSRYTFYWNMGERDYECSFEIIVNGENVFEALQYESESGPVSDCEDFTTEEPFFTAIAEAKWGTSADAETFTYGTLADAFAAAYPYDEENETYISSEIRYIQLLSDVANDNGYCIRGGEYTLDLNGKTLKSNGYTLDIRGGKVIIADESSDKSGKVITTGFDVTAIYINEGSPKITIEGGQYKSNNQSAVSIESESCEVKINGGEFTTTESADKLITNLGTLTINGGTFDAQNAQYAIYVGGKTTISDGTFVGAQTADVTYCGGTLTFEATEATDETPGFSPMGLSVYYQAEDGVVADIILPEGYGFYNSDDEAVTDFQYDLMYYIGKTEGAGYTVTFSANYDTEATMDDAIVTSPNGKYVLPECEFTAPDGKMFDGWQVGDDENNLYQPGERITVTANTVVKAVWGDIKIVINMSDSYGDGWGGAYIEVLKDDESIGTATLVDGYDGRATFDYDSNCTYSFIWHSGLDEFEISFKISIGEEQIFTAEKGDCEEYADGQQIYPVPTLDELAITDGTMEEFNMGKTKVGTLTYTRTLPNLKWNALYVPFEIPVSALTENYDVAYVNDIRSYDENEDGVLDRMTMEIIKLSSGTLHANHPYLIRAKNEEAKNMNLVLTDATLYNTVENSFTCSSMYMDFTVTGSYNSLSAEDLEGKYAISEDGAWQLLNEGTTLKPFRLYMEMTARDGSPVKVESAALSRIRISVQGEEDGATGIEMVDTPQHEADGAFFDLSGRKVKAPVKGGIYIRNGKKILVK